jgi:hypothetical protein
MLSKGIQNSAKVAPPKKQNQNEGNNSLRDNDHREETTCIRFKFNPTNKQQNVRISRHYKKRSYYPNQVAIIQLFS